MDGDIPLADDALSDWPSVLRALPARGWVTAEDVNAALGHPAPGQALAAKLVALRRRGLVVSRRCECGHSLLWRITPDGSEYLTD
jgi:hypothetical protein